jgi:4,5-DOPA dioxygenase extradiol
MNSFERMPALFIGHGNPMNAIEDTEFARAWECIGASLRRPKAVLAISAHWYVEGTFVTAMDNPRTIHDFGGFPPALHDVRYPAPGDPELAARVQRLASRANVLPDTSWGLDHGAWSVLRRLFPDANVPVVQLSLDEGQPPAFHHALGRELGALRDEGVLVLGSGNVVHNLEAYSWGQHSASPFGWATRFEQRVRDCILAGDHGPLIDYESLGKDAALSVPTPEHYLPLLHVLGMRQPGDAIAFPVEGMDGGSISMLCVRVG